MEVGVSEVEVDHMGWREIVFICVQLATWPLAIGCLSHDLCTMTARLTEMGTSLQIPLGYMLNITNVSVSTPVVYLP